MCSDVKSRIFDEKIQCADFHWPPDRRNFENLTIKSSAFNSSQPVDMSRYQVFWSTPSEHGDPALEKNLFFQTCHQLAGEL